MAYFTIEKVVRTSKENKLNTRYRTTVREKEKGRVLYSKKKTFNTKASALKWAKKLILLIEAGERPEDQIKTLLTLGELIQRYVAQINKSNKPLGRSASFSLNQTCRYPLAKIGVNELSSKHIVDFCYDRLNAPTKPQAQTIAMDISFIRAVLFHAKSMFDVNVDQTAVIESYPTLKRLRLISRSNQRTRRLMGNEYNHILTALQEYQSKPRTTIPYADLFEMSILTCLRVSELCQLEWKNLIAERSLIKVLNRKHPSQKQGNNMLLPLLGEGRALEIILNQPRVHKFIFPYKPKSVTSGFRKVSREIGVNGLRYHDLRREGCSNLIDKGFSLPQVAAVSGHKDIKILHNIYVSLYPDSLISFELEAKSRK